MTAGREAETRERRTLARGLEPGTLHPHPGPGRTAGTTVVAREAPGVAGRHGTGSLARSASGSDGLGAEGVGTGPASPRCRGHGPGCLRSRAAARTRTVDGTALPLPQGADPGRGDACPRTQWTSRVLFRGPDAHTYSSSVLSPRRPRVRSGPVAEDGSRSVGAGKGDHDRAGTGVPTHEARTTQTP